MQTLLELASPLALVAAIFIGVLAGFVKGAIGFALPMIMISGLGSFLSADLALAALILPVLVTNMTQALRDGPVSAVRTAYAYRDYVLFLAFFLVASAQLVRHLPQSVLLLMLGIPVVLFSVLQLAGWRLRVPAHRERLVRWSCAGTSGFIGGLSGIWGPPTAMFLTAMNTPREDSLRIQGIIYGLGAVMLVLAHLGSGVLNSQTVVLSALMIVPSSIGLWVGYRASAGMDHEKFRTVTLFVLVIAGLNLVRRGLIV